MKYAVKVSRQIYNILKYSDLVISDIINLYYELYKNADINSSERLFFAKIIDELFRIYTDERM
jgi:hypothetical protein